MEELDFLNKLIVEGKLKLVEPSENVKEAYLVKSRSYIDSAKLLLNNNKLEEAVSMAYYSMYYSLLALLFKSGIKSENHTASILLLKELFGFDNSELIKAKKERIDKQYYVDFEVTRNEVLELIRAAEKFNAEMFDFIEKMSNEDIKKVRNKFKELIKNDFK